MQTLFTTPITTERHKKLGICEKSDFGSLKLFSLTKEEKQLVVSFKRYGKETEYILLNSIIYIKIDAKSRFVGLSREGDTKWCKKQGKFSNKSALELMLELRKSYESSYSHASNTSFIIIDKTLYVEYCKKNQLNITVAGNLLFSCWLSIDIESHEGKKNIKLTKANLEATITKEKARFNIASKSKSGKVDDHVSFSCPASVKWGSSIK